MVCIRLDVLDDMTSFNTIGKSDPFVQVLLLPSFVFLEANKRIHKTERQKETLNPFFNETINL